MAALILSEKEREDHCALALAKAQANVRIAYAAKHRHCQLMAKENQPCWHEERGLQIAMHLLEAMTPEQFEAILLPTTANSQQPTTNHQKPQKSDPNYNTYLADEAMKALQRGSKAGWWKGHKQ